MGAVRKKGEMRAGERREGQENCGKQSMGYTITAHTGSCVTYFP